MRKKMLSLQGLMSIMLLTSVPSWSASPIIDDKDLAFEDGEYGVLLGGFLDFSKQTNFKGDIDQMGKFVNLCRESSLATVGFSAFGRMAVMINLGTSSASGTLAASATDPELKTHLNFETHPSMIWGGKLGVQLYNEGCVKAMGCAKYHQASMPIKMVSGIVSRRHYQLIPGFDTANNMLGLYLVPNALSSSYVQPTQSFTSDSLVISMPHTVYDPANVTLEFSQYELGLIFGYGQQNTMYVGAKIVGGMSSFTTSDATIKNAINQDLGGLIQAILGTKDPVTKVDGTRSCYISPVVGFSICGKGLSIDIQTSLLAQQDLTLRACLTF